MSSVLNVPCFYCQTPVNALAPSTYRRVVGWERKALAASRKSGSDIALREPRDEYACDTCVGRLRAGVSVAQEPLL